MRVKIKLSLIFSIFLIYTGIAQNNFYSEVTAIQEKYNKQIESKLQHIVFTGSSSIRFWDNLPLVFNDYSIVNTGFGGSQASDLLEVHQELILDFNPKKVFIYEGDNDIAFGKKSNKILKTIKKISRKIKRRSPDVAIVLIAAKPSIRRWNLKEKYVELNNKFERLSNRKKYIEYADVWSIMLEGDELNRTLFIQDGLHMNKKGYDLWEKAIKEFL